MKLFPKLIISMSIFAALGVGGMAALFYTFGLPMVESQAGISQVSTTKQVAITLDRFFYERGRDLQGLSQDPDVTSSLVSATAANISEATQELAATKSLNSAWTSVMLIDDKGLVKASSDGRMGKGGFMDAYGDSASLLAKASGGGLVYSEVFSDPSQGEPTMFVIAPIKIKGHLSGAVAGKLGWSAWGETVRGPSDQEVSVLDSHGRLVASSQQSAEGLLTRNFSSSTFYHKAREKATGYIATTETPSASKEKQFLSYAAEPGFSAYGGLGWIVMLTTPYSKALGGIPNLTLISLVGFWILSVIFVVVMLYVLNRQLIGPVRILTSAVGRVALGDLSQTVPVSGKDELGSLGRSFNEMTHQLASTYRSLQETTAIAHEGRAQLESSINGLRQGFILIDVHGKTVMVNGAAKEMIRSSYTGRSKHKRHSSLEGLTQLVKDRIDLAEKIEHTLTHREQIKFSSLPLGGRFLNIYLSPVINDAESIGCVVLLEDVTEERILQRSRDEFFSIASHELRTPLTAIRGNTAMLQQYYPKALKDPTVHEMIDDIHNSAERLIEIVNDFLDASRLEQNKMKFSPATFSIEDTIEKVMYELSGLSRDEKVKIDFDQHTLGELPVVYADQNRVKQVLYNLIGNSMKFTLKGSVTINCLLERPFIKICVTDTGVGISPEGRQLLFHKFQQTGDNILTRDNTRGTGLGLYISKLLVQYMGGEIKLEHTEVGKGSTFSFTLPLATEEQLKKATAPEVSDVPEGNEPTPKKKRS